MQGMEAVIRTAIASDADLTLAAPCALVAQRGGPQVSEKTVCVELQRLELPRKKSPSLPVSGRRRG